MKDEIKEILSKMERLIVYGQYNAYYDLEKQLLDCITNLQEENEKNKTYSEFYKDMSNRWKDLLDVFKIGYEYYKSRCEKAIEKIDKVEEHCTTPIFNTRGFLNDIKNTLNGGDEK